MQPPAITEGDGCGKRSLVQANAGKRKFLVAALLQLNVTEGERALAAGRLLSVTEVARLLGVCSATVYALCAKGDLPHVRVLNAIRVAPGDLEAFTSQRAASKGRHRTVTVAWADSPRIRLNLLTPKPN